VIDEADHMADLGFLPVVRELLASTPERGQRLLFSATLDNAVDVLVQRFLKSPAVHSVDSANAPTPNVVHHLLTVSWEDRFEVLCTLASGGGRSLIFTKTKHSAVKLAKQLTEAQIPAVDLHGNLTQRARERNLATFSSGAARVMIATDIAARGIHVDGIELVVHADPPAEHKAYLHRSGRTARAGADGVVVTLQTAAQANSVRTLMKKANVRPVITRVDPDSELLRELAGEAAPLVAAPVTPVRIVEPRSDRPRRDDAGRRPRTGSGSGRPRTDAARRPGNDGSGWQPRPKSADRQREGAKDGDRGVSRSNPHHSKHRSSAQGSQRSR
jgi:superfamily II DNA/RNA helicase